MVEKGARRRAVAEDGGLDNIEYWRGEVGAALRESDAPALVEALAEIADLDLNVPAPVDDLDSARLNGWQEAARIARAVLGGARASRSPHLEALIAIHRAVSTFVLNDEDAQARHQRIYDLATDALVEAGVLAAVDGETTTTKGSDR